MMLYIQLLSIVFSVACTIHDVPAVDSFTYYGSNPKTQSKFHAGNLLLKSCYIGAIYLLSGNWRYALLSALIVWLFFDPLLNVQRTPRHSFFYLSTSNRTDRTLLKLLGKNAGVYKFAACVITIIILNYFFYDRRTAL